MLKSKWKIAKGLSVMFLLAISTSSTLYAKKVDQSEVMMNELADIVIEKVKSDNKHASVKQTPPVVQCVALNLFNSLRDPKNSEWQFLVYQSDEVNMPTALPNRHLLIPSALLELNSDPQFLASSFSLALAQVSSGNIHKRFRKSGDSAQLIELSQSRKKKLKNKLWNIVMPRFGLGHELNQLTKYSVKERKSGLKGAIQLTAKAGFFPKGMLDLFEQLSPDKKGVFANAYPNRRTQIENARKYLPRAMRTYKKKKEANQLTNCTF